MFVQDCGAAGRCFGRWHNEHSMPPQIHYEMEMRDARNQTVGCNSVFRYSLFSLANDSYC